MTVEYKEGIPSADEIGYAEHSRASSAKKVVEVAPCFAEHADGGRTADPINGTLTGASASLTLAKAKGAYRVIGSVAFHFRLSNGANTAVTTDIYQPANVPLVVRTSDKWDTISAIKAAGASDGIFQAMLVL